MIRRVLTAIIIVLLIGIPAGYLVISAEQSRNSGNQNEEKALATGLTDGWPSTMQRRIFEVPIPERALGVWYYQTNNWKVSRLYVQFTTNQARRGRVPQGCGGESHHSAGREGHGPWP